MDDFIELAELIEEYRVKIADLSDYESYYYIDYANLNRDFEKILSDIKDFINTKFAVKFMQTYNSDEEILGEIEQVLQEFMQEVKKLKGIYKSLEKYEPYDEILKIYIRIAAKILNQIDIFLIKLENIVLKGGEGSLQLELDISKEIDELREKLYSKDTTLLSFLAGFGLGWFIFGGDGE